MEGEHLSIMSEWVIPWIDFLRWEFVRMRAYKPGDEYHWARHDTAPFAPMTKPLNQCRVSLCQSAARLKKQGAEGVEPVEEPGEMIMEPVGEWGEIPKDADVKKLVYPPDSWVSGYDAKQDPNIAFPLDRFRELEKEGFIGELAPVVFSSQGSFGTSAIMRETPKQVKRLKELKIDALVFTSI